jgi:prepilin-type processing-associated H-X9-DG protein
VEILIVVGIVLVLVAILLPALATARNSAKAASCLNNMRQIATAFTAYAMDNQGYTPYQTADRVYDFANPNVYRNANINDVSCLALLLRYVGGTTQTYICPSAMEQTYDGLDVPTALSDTNYLANQLTLIRPNPASMTQPVGRPLSGIPNGSSVVFLQEWGCRSGDAYLRPYQSAATAVPRQNIYSDWCDDDATWGQEYSYVHRHGGNLAFVDGHAEWRAASELHPSDFGLIGIPGTSNTNDPDTLQLSNSNSYYPGF